MQNPEVIFERDWVVGGYEADPDVESEWRPWRDRRISTRLENEIKQVSDECQQILLPIVGDVTTGSGFITTMLLEEARVNLFGHGKRGLPNRSSAISLKIESGTCENAEAHRFTLRMQDDLDVFDIEHLPDPRFDENLCEVTGRGIVLIREKCRAFIRQIPLDDGGKIMEYEWRDPSYELHELGDLNEQAGSN